MIPLKKITKKAEDKTVTTSAQEVGGFQPNSHRLIEPVHSERMTLRDAFKGKTIELRELDSDEEAEDFYNSIIKRLKFENVNKDQELIDFRLKQNFDNVYNQLEGTLFE